MTRKSGSILLEVLIASAISAFILSSLYSILSQVNNNVARMDKISSIDMRAFLLQEQLERDLSGAFIIYKRQPKEAGKKDEGVKSTSGDVDKEKDKAGTGEAIGKKKKQEYENVPIEKGFLSENDGDNIKILSFITNNPLKFFDKPKPLMARVVYKLIKDTQVRAVGKSGGEGQSFRLFRQEGTVLGFDEFNKTVAKSTDYELVKNIKKMSVDYTIMIKSGEDKDKKDGDVKSQGQTGQGKENAKDKEPAKEQKIEYKNFNKWTDVEIKKTKKYRPDFCKFIVELWDDGKKTFKTFEFKIYIYQVVAKSEPEQKAEFGQQSQLSRLSSGVGQNSQAGLGNNLQGNINLDVILGKNNNNIRASVGTNSGVNGRINNNIGKKINKKKSVFNMFLSGNKL